MCGHAYVGMPVWRPACRSLRFMAEFSQLFLTLFFEEWYLSWTHSSPIWWVWPASLLQEPHLSLLGPDSWVICHTHLAFLCVLEIWTSLVSVCSKQFNHWTISTAMLPFSFPSLFGAGGLTWDRHSASSLLALHLLASGFALYVGEQL